jgi:outer membrane protein OmpA-like peptidoglycan-associated protein
MISKTIYSKMLVSCFALVLTGCVTTNEYGQTGPRNAAEGAGMGALGGALAGAAIGSFSGNAGRGALIGAVSGALVGAAVGDYMEKQRLDFERALANEIGQGHIRITKLADDRLIVRMTSATTFNVDSAQIKPRFYSTLDKIANIVNRYGKTRLEIAGHTDNTGNAAHNMSLSRHRADSVQSYLYSAGVDGRRMHAYGYGENQPIASNSTDWGRRLNRRVDIMIVPLQG